MYLARAGSAASPSLGDSDAAEIAGATSEPSPAMLRWYVGAAALEAQGLQEIPLHVLCVRHAAKFRDDLAGQGQTLVRVLEVLRRRIERPWLGSRSITCSRVGKSKLGAVQQR